MTSQISEPRKMKVDNDSSWNSSKSELPESESEPEPEPEPDSSTMLTSLEQHLDLEPGSATYYSNPNASTSSYDATITTSIGTYYTEIRNRRSLTDVQY